MTHPYSIFVWQPPLTAHGDGHWGEPAQCFTEQDALYIANLMHQDSHAVIKVVRYGLNLASFPDAHAVELVEKQIASRREHMRLKSRTSRFSNQEYRMRLHER